MPYRRVSSRVPTSDPDLVRELSEELRRERPDGPPDAPFILEEELPRSDYVHVTVIWDKWRPLDPEARSHLIMDSYREVRGVDGVTKISTALGLTHAEAQKLGIAAVSV
jgi:hypothetical protein